MLPHQAGASGPGGASPAQAQQAHLAYMQQYQQAQLRQQVAYMQQAMMAYPGGSPYQMPAYPGAVPYMGGLPQGMGGMGMGMMGKSGGGKGSFDGGKGKFGKGNFKGGNGGKGKKGGFKGGKSKGRGDDDDAEGGDGEGGEDTERAPRIRKDEPPIVKAQREARERAEADILKHLQGRWVDAADKNIRYTVEGNTCSVANKSTPGGRVFHNRLSMYGVEFCWNAKRFWHDLNLTDMRAAGDEPETIEWNPGKTSPPAEQIVWNRDTSPPTPEEPKESEDPEPETADAADDAQNAEAAPAADES